MASTRSSISRFTSFFSVIHCLKINPSSRNFPDHLESIEMVIAIQACLCDLLHTALEFYSHILHAPIFFFFFIYDSIAPPFYPIIFRARVKMHVFCGIYAHRVDYSTLDLAIFSIFSFFITYF